MQYNHAYCHVLRLLQGSQIIEQMDYAAWLSAAARTFNNDNGDPAGIPAGSVLMDTANGLVTGCTGNSMALFLPKCTWDPDANVDYFTGDGRAIVGIGINSMAGYSHENIQDPNWQTNLYPTQGADTFTYVPDRPYITVYPGKACLELASSEFDPNAQYAPGTLLSSPPALDPTDAGYATATTQEKRGGYLKIAEAGERVIGVVSRGVKPSEYKIPLLCFWPYSHPVFVPGE